MSTAATDWPWVLSGPRGCPPVDLCVPPWQSWAHRLAMELQLDGAFEEAVPLLVEGGLRRFRRALRILRQGGSDPGLNDWLLRLATLPGSRRPANPPVGSMDEVTDLPHDGTRGPAILWGLAARLAGYDPAPWIQFGRAIGPLVELVASWRRLWLDPNLDSLADLRLEPLFRPLVADEATRGPLLLVLAGARNQPARMPAIRAFLAGPQARPLLDAAWISQHRLARMHLPVADPAPGRSFLDAMGSAWQWSRSYQDFWYLASSVLPVDPSPTAREGLVLALSFLRERAPWPEAWETRREPFLDSEDRLVSSFWQRGQILRALHDMGEPVAAGIRELLSEQGPDLRWFGPWKGIPPDADSLGMALALAARVPGTFRETWLAPLRAGLSPGDPLPTWFYEGSDGPTLDDPHRVYQGQDCLGTRLNLLVALLENDPDRFGPLVESQVDAVLAACAPEGLRGVFFYGQAWASAAFCAFAAAFIRLRPDSPQAAPLAIARDSLIARIRRDQRLDGSWGSPQDTALHMLALAPQPEQARPGASRTDLRRAARFLAESQRPDGSWSAGPLYGMPAHANRVSWHESRDAATALCATALWTVLHHETEVEPG